MNSQPISWLASGAGASGLMDNNPSWCLKSSRSIRPFGPCPRSKLALSERLSQGLRELHRQRIAKNKCNPSGRWPLAMALQQQQHLGLFIDESICGRPTHLFALPFVREHTWLKAGKDKQICTAKQQQLLLQRAACLAFTESRF